jgi:hypothetical protein
MINTMTEATVVSFLTTADSALRSTSAPDCLMTSKRVPVSPNAELTIIRDD